MARIKVDWSKVEWTGPKADDFAALTETLPESLKPLAVDGGITVKPVKVQIVAGEGEKAKQFGAAFLKIETAKDESVDTILAVIKAAGKQAVIDAHNSIKRDERVSFLTKNFGDVSKTIDALVAGMVESGWDAEEARAAILKNREKAGLRVS